jgi:translation initiation factor IF-3
MEVNNGTWTPTVPPTEVVRAAEAEAEDNAGIVVGGEAPTDPEDSPARTEAPAKAEAEPVEEPAAAVADEPPVADSEDAAADEAEEPVEVAEAQDAPAK